MNTSTNTTATIRTGWYIGVVTVVTAGASKLFGWTVEVEDLMPYAPAAAVGAGIVYRALLLAVNKWPWIGYIVFGDKQAPVAYVKPEEQAVAENAVEQAIK